MICRQCGTDIADRALICYRCGTATSAPRITPPSDGSLFERPPRRWQPAAAVAAAIVLGLAGACVFLQ